MSDWRFLAFRPDGRGRETLLHQDLPALEPKLGRVLSGIHSFDFSISPRTLELMASDGRPLIERWGTTIYAERDGVIQGGYIVESITAQGEKLNVKCVGFLGYAKGMPFTAEFIGYEVDPMDMARFIWAHIQSGTNGNIGLVIDTKDTDGKVKIGVRPKEAFRGRPAITTLPNGKGEIVLPAAPAYPAVQDAPYRLAWYETHDLLDAFVKLATETPFDFREKHWWEGGEIQHFIEFDYPRRLNRQILPKFVVGENVFVAPKYTIDDADYATDVMLLGAGEGSKMIKGYATDHSQGMLRRAKVIKSAAIGRQQTAQLYAKKNLELFQGDFSVADLTVKNTDLAPFGSYDVGDLVKLVTSDDEWIKGQEAWVRILELDVSPADDDDVSLVVERI